MTNEELETTIDAMQAHLEKKPEPRKPREFFINIYPLPYPREVCESRDEANRCADWCRSECIHVREVLDD